MYTTTLPRRSDARPNGIARSEQPGRRATFCENELGNTRALQTPASPSLDALEVDLDMKLMISLLSPCSNRTHQYFVASRVWNDWSASADMPFTWTCSKSGTLVAHALRTHGAKAVCWQNRYYMA